MTGFLWSNDEEAFFGSSPSSQEGNRTPKSKRRPGETQETPLSITQLNARIKQVLDQSFQSLWVVGEIGNLTQSNAGHVYLTLKDATGQISAVIWRSTLERLEIDIAEGMAVIAQGRLDIYSPRGTYQFIVSRLEQQGLGSLQAEFRRMYNRLKQEGLFSPERKKPLPAYPLNIGFVTSPSGAAIHDFVQVLRRRWPMARVLIIPSRVQGEGAAEEIARGIRTAQRIRPSLDVLVVGRGGGSLEDLWCFNEEVVVRAIANSTIPTISAVGHEVDVTLCDLAADLRALTPTEAAEVVAPHRDELLQSLEETERRLHSLAMIQIQRSEARWNSLATRAILEDPTRLLDKPTQWLDEVHRDLDLALDKGFEQQNQRLQASLQLLDVLNPLHVMARGFSVTSLWETGKLITKVEDIAIGQTIRTQFSNGEIRSVVVNHNDSGPRSE